MDKKIVSGIMTVLLLTGILSIPFVQIVRSADIIQDVWVTSIEFYHITVHGIITVNTTYNGWDVNLIYILTWIYNTGHEPARFEVAFTYTIANVPTTIGVTFVDVMAEGTGTASVSFDTRGFPAGYLPITVEATKVLNEEYTVDNNLTTILLIKHVGDVESDADVDMYDFGEFAQAYATSLGDPKYNVECDFDRDGDVDMFDFSNLAKNFATFLPPYETL